MDTNSIMSRVMRVYRFDASVYREIAADPNAMSGALVVAIVGILIGSLGSLGALFTGDIGSALVGIVIAIVGGLIGFALFSFVASLVAQNMFQGKTNFQEMMRTLGYCYAWQPLNIVGIIPCVGWLMSLVVVGLVVVSGVIALRESAEFDTTKAAITIGIAAVVLIAIYVCIGVGLTTILVALGLAAGAGQ